MKQLEGPTVEGQDEQMQPFQDTPGSVVNLPGRFPIFTDGTQHNLSKDLVLETALQHQDDVDERVGNEIKRGIQRLLKGVRKKLKADGRNPIDWKYTVMIAVHHKGQATDFWFGDGPEKEVKVDQNLPENLRKPVEAQRLKIEKR